MKAHPYADAWPMLGDDELAELADDIVINGLRDSIVTYGGLILDGRNRFAACQKAGVEPTFTEFDGTDDEALAFARSTNTMRRHQSKGSRAMSDARALHSAGKRRDGRWERGAVDIGRKSDTAEAKALNRCGLILDYAPELSEEVIYERMTLVAAYDLACEARDEHLRKQEEERLAAEAEAKAQRFIESEAPDLAKAVGTNYETFLEAEAVWKVRNAEEAKARADKERAEREKKAAIERGIKDSLSHISNAVQFLATTNPEVFAEHTLPHRDRYPNESRYLTTEHFDSAIDYLTTARKALQ